MALKIGRDVGAAECTVPSHPQQLVTRNTERSYSSWLHASTHPTQTHMSHTRYRYTRPGKRAPSVPSSKRAPQRAPPAQGDKMIQPRTPKRTPVARLPFPAPAVSPHDSALRSARHLHPLLVFLETADLELVGGVEKSARPARQSDQQGPGPGRPQDEDRAMMTRLCRARPAPPSRLRVHPRPRAHVHRDSRQPWMHTALRAARHAPLAPLYRPGPGPDRITRGRSLSRGPCHGSDAAHGWPNPTRAGTRRCSVN